MLLYASPSAPCWVNTMEQDRVHAVRGFPYNGWGTALLLCYHHPPQIQWWNFFPHGFWDKTLGFGIKVSLLSLGFTWEFKPGA